MTRFTLRPTLAVSALLVAAGTCLADGRMVAEARGEGSGAEHAKANPAPARVIVPKQEVYSRPFCRRSRYVTNRSAPCW
jgi:hypothetical protein